MFSTDSLSITTNPELTDPILIAAWPGMGAVGVIAATYLRDKLEAEELGTISPYEFFDPGAVLVYDNIVQAPELPESMFYYWKGNNKQDLIIFTAEAQPVIKSYQYASLVLDVAEKFNVKMIYTCAATPAHIYYSREPKVIGVATEPELLPGLDANGVKLLTTGSISGLNGVLLGIARKREMRGVCLMGEIPVYMPEVKNPRAAKAVLKILMQRLNLDIDMSEIDNWVSAMDEEVEKNIFQLMTSSTEEAKRIVDYLERLKQKGDSEEAEGWSDQDDDEELLKEVERFLQVQKDDPPPE